MGVEDRIYRLEKTSHSTLEKLDPNKTGVIVAMSPLEVHGPHLPVGQDWFEAITLMERTVEKVLEIREDWSFIIMPPIPIAEDCVPQLGSVNYPVNVVKEVAYRTLLPFAKHGFKRLIYSSFHGGPRHMTSLEWAADKLSTEYDVAAISLFSAVVAGMLGDTNVFFDAVKDHPDNPITLDQIDTDWHAGFVETSIALHLWPELVEDGWEKLPPLSKKVAANEEKHGTYFMGNEGGEVLMKIQKVVSVVQNFKESIEHYNEHTYSGFPGMASAEMGKIMLEHLLEISTDIMCDFLDRGSKVEGHTPLWKFRGVILNNAANTILSDHFGLYQDKAGKKAKK